MRQLSEAPIYSEKLTSWKTQALFVTLAALLGGLLAVRLKSHGWDALAVIWLGLALFFLFYAINYRVLSIGLTAEQLILKFGLMTWKVPFDNIERCERDELPAFLALGGAGVHFLFVRGRYRVSFNFLEYPRVVIALREAVGPVRDVSFSTRKPEVVMEAVRKAVAPRMH